MYSINASIVGVAMGSFNFYGKISSFLVNDENKSENETDRFKNRIFHDIFINVLKIFIVNILDKSYLNL